MSAQLENSEQAKKTPLYSEHARLGAKFTEFGGWSMPVLYSGLVDEHLTVRRDAGIFDVSHMGEIIVSGPKAFEYLQYLTSNDISKLTPGKAHYSLLLNPDGGVVDDIIVYMLKPETYLICVNAGNTEKDWRWMEKHNTQGANLENKSAAYAQIAIQGPKARAIVSQCLADTDTDYSRQSFKPFTFKVVKHRLPDENTAELIVACTGYTGEDGFEIFYPAANASALWNELLEVGSAHGLKPCGLGARDTLRLEVCYPLHGHELSDTVSALASGVGWVVKFDKGDFIGRSALYKEKTQGGKFKLVGLEVLDKGIIREGAKISAKDGLELGWVTSGTKPPTVNKAIGLAFVLPEYAKIGSEFFANVREKLLPVRVIEKPFYKPL